MAWRRPHAGGGGGRRSIAVDLAQVVGDFFGGDVPAAVRAGRGLVVAAVAVERAAEEELLEAVAALGVEVAGSRGTESASPQPSQLRWLNFSRSGA